VAVFAGADAVRVHDAAGAARALAVAFALRRARAEVSA
jgi:dihydropteroate synthase